MIRRLRNRAARLSAAQTCALLTVAAPAAAAASSADDVLRGTGLSFPYAQPALGQGLELVGALDPDARAVSSTAPSAAAGLTVTYGTTLHALRDRADLQPGETLAVLGASGGVGQAAVEIGKVMGARVIACAQK